VDYRRGTDGQTAEAEDLKARERKARDNGSAVGLGGLRASDIEPYTGLRYLSKLFRFMAVVLLLVLVAEVATGLYTQGAASIPTLLGEASRLIVLAGVLWGTGDLAHLLIDVGHDVRAGRILMARSAAGGAAFMPRDRATQARAKHDRSIIEGTDVAVADRSASNPQPFADRPLPDTKGEPPIP
jgi:hypothetical protein